ncbi:MAG: helix-turn-helix transcriptional regulator [Gemmatimonadetes bacterium]|nr:helix-turn-helix transcriptional regulator [Gemmatimonadota bacterium]
MTRNGRVDPREPFTIMEKMVVLMVGRGLPYVEVAGRLSIKKSTVKMHTENAAAKLPGDDPPRMKVQIWFRGADEQVLAPGSER